MSGITGNIHSIETCGTVDGPGIRYVIFMQGCALRCIYCHNPDTWEIGSKSSPVRTTGELLSDILKYKSYFKHSGGGVTLTGGEPLLQKEFAAELFKICKQAGINTALDTSGCIKLDEKTKAVLKYTDVVLLDVKSINEGAFKKITGASIKTVKSFAEYLKEKNIPVWLRYVLVPGLTDNENDLHTLAEYLTAFNNIERITILPFHQMGKYKWQDLKLDYKLADTQVPSAGEVEKVKKLMKQYGFKVE
jgi:pyruvate formate lyase activating enzyme